MRIRTRVIGGGYSFLLQQKGGKALNSLSPRLPKGGQRRKREVISRG